MEAYANTPRTTRIAVFYDGSYFCNISDYYRLWHSRGAQLCHNGLHQFIKSKVAQLEKTGNSNCNIVDAHYFRGRFAGADLVKNSATLLRDRMHDEALMEVNITTHYLPMQRKAGGEEGYTEKGIDVWFALEAYELTLLKKYDIVVLITGDADHLPLIRKLTALNTRVMLLYWNINVPSRTDIKGAITSKTLVKAATYPVNMVEEINSGNGNPVIENMFILNKENVVKQKQANKKKEEKKNPEVKPRENRIPVNEALRSQIFTVSKSIENVKTQTAGYVIDLTATELRPRRKRIVHEQKIKNTAEQNVKSPAAIETPSAKIKEVHTKPVEAKKVEVKPNAASQNKSVSITQNLEQNIAVSNGLGNAANAIANNTALCLYKATCTALIHIPTAAATATTTATPVKKRLKNLTGRQKGVITWIDYHRGIGKVDISSDYPSITFYCNAKSMNKFKSLKKNNLVEFDLKKSPNGTFAVNLKSAAA